MFSQPHQISRHNMQLAKLNKATNNRVDLSDAASNILFLIHSDLEELENYVNTNFGSKKGLTKPNFIELFLPYVFSDEIPSIPVFSSRKVSFQVLATLFDRIDTDSTGRTTWNQIYNFFRESYDRVHCLSGNQGQHAFKRRQLKGGWFHSKELSKTVTGLIDLESICMARELSLALLVDIHFSISIVSMNSWETVACSPNYDKKTISMKVLDVGDSAIPQAVCYIPIKKIFVISLVSTSGSILRCFDAVNFRRLCDGYSNSAEKCLEWYATPQLLFSGSHLGEIGVWRWVSSPHAQQTQPNSSIMALQLEHQVIVHQGPVKVVVALPSLEGIVIASGGGKDGVITLSKITPATASTTSATFSGAEEEQRGKTKKVSSSSTTTSAAPTYRLKSVRSVLAHDFGIVAMVYDPLAHLLMTAGNSCIPKIWPVSLKAPPIELREDEEEGKRGKQDQQATSTKTTTTLGAILQQGEGNGNVNSSKTVVSQSSAPSPLSAITATSNHQNMVCSLLSNPSMFQFFSLDTKGLIKIWDTRTFKSIQTIRSCANIRVQRIAEWKSVTLVQPNVAITIGGMPSEIFTSQGTAETMQTHQCDISPISHVLFNLMDSTIMSGSNVNLKLWNGKTGQLVSSFDDSTSSKMTCLTTDSSGRRLFVGTSSGEVSCHNYTNGLRLQTISAHERNCAVVSLSYVASGSGHQLLISCGADAKIVVSNVALTSRDPPLTLINMAVAWATVVKQFDCFAACGTDRRLFLWDTTSFHPKDGFLFLNCYSLSSALRSEAVPTCMSFLAVHGLIAVPDGQDISLLKLGSKVLRLLSWSTFHGGVVEGMAFLPSTVSLMVLEDNGTIVQFSIGEQLHQVSSSGQNVGSCISDLRDPHVMTTFQPFKSKVSAFHVCPELAICIVANEEVECFVFSYNGEILGKMSIADTSLQDWKVVTDAAPPKKNKGLLELQAQQEEGQSTVTERAQEFQTWVKKQTAKGFVPFGTLAKVNEEELRSSHAIGVKHKLSIMRSAPVIIEGNAMKEDHDAVLLPSMGGGEDILKDLPKAVQEVVEKFNTENARISRVWPKPPKAELLIPKLELSNRTTESTKDDPENLALDYTPKRDRGDGILHCLRLATKTYNPPKELVDAQYQLGLRRAAAAPKHIHLPPFVSTSTAHSPSFPSQSQSQGSSSLHLGRRAKSVPPLESGLLSQPITTIPLETVTMWGEDDDGMRVYDEKSSHTSLTRKRMLKSRTPLPVDQSTMLMGTAGSSGKAIKKLLASIMQPQTASTVPTWLKMRSTQPPRGGGFGGA